MVIQDFIKQFANQFDDTDSLMITAQTAYQDLDEWSSLTALSIIAFIRTEYDKSVTGKQVRACKTVGELFDLVTSL